MTIKPAEMACLPGFVEYLPGESFTGKVMAVNTTNRTIEEGETFFIEVKTKKEVEKLMKELR